MARGRKQGSIPYDVRGVESTGGDFELPPVGLYRVKIVSAVYEEPQGKDPRTHVIFQITHDAKGKKIKANYSQIHRYYTYGENAIGFWRQFLEAVGVVQGKKGEKGTLSEDDLVGQEVLLRVKHEVWKESDGGDGEARPRAGNVMALPDDDEDTGDDEDDDDDSDDDDDDDSSEDEDDDDDDDDEDDEEDDEDEDDEDDDDDDDDDDEDDEDETPDWSEMTIVDLEKAVKENDGKVVSVVGRGAKAKKGAARKKALVKWLEENASGDDEDEDYNEWDLSDLKEELKERGESTKGSKATLVKRLEKLDEAESKENPF